MKANIKIDELPLNHTFPIPKKTGDCAKFQKFLEACKHDGCAKYNKWTSKQEVDIMCSFDTVGKILNYLMTTVPGTGISKLNDPTDDYKKYGTI